MTGPNLTPRYTEEQQAVLNAVEVSVGLSAGAGCGKTFVLTQRFLARLQPDSGAESLSRNVAITFTERAAREMRDRIRSTAQQFLESCENDHVLHWQQVLRGLDSARISTIHSFCSSLLRQQAVEARLDPAFEILEPGTAVAFRNRVVIDTLNRLLAGGHESAVFLVRYYGLEGTRRLLRELLQQHLQIDFDRFHELTPDQLSAAWLERWHSQTIPLCIRQFQESSTVQHLLRLLGEHQSDHPEMIRRCAFLRDHLPTLAECENLAVRLGELQECAKVQGGGSKKNWPDETIYEQVKNGLTAVREELGKLAARLTPDTEHLEMATRYGLHALRVVREVSRTYENRKREHALLDFDDLLIRARDLLRNNEIIRQRVAEGIDFLMVDEFQDTDPDQSEIVRWLCGAALFDGKLFFVGDVKQSIYRFRKADPNVFRGLRNEIHAPGKLSLTRNFRSQPAVLNFVNALFGAAMGDEYEPLTPHVEQISPTPCIEFLLANRPASEADEVEKPAAHDLRKWEADWMARRISQLLADETPRIRQKNQETGQAELRRVRAGDIVILFRSLSNVALYEEALRRQGVEYYLAGGRAFYAQQEIYDLVNLCQWLDDPADQVSLIGVLRSPFFSLSDDSLFALGQTGKILSDALAEEPPDYLPEEQQRQIRYAWKVLSELRGLKDRMPLASLLSLALERTGYDAALVTEFLGARKLANLRKLIEMARKFDQTGLFTLKDFTQRLRESVSEQTDEELAATHPEQSDVVRMMTIHQSKGLEFPVVIVADIGWGRGGGGGDSLLHPELGPLVRLPVRFGQSFSNLGLEMHRLHEAVEDERETIRLFYVATTRAADHLILSAGMDPASKSRGPWLKLLGSCFDLETGLPAADPYLGKLTLGEVHSSQIPEIKVHRQPPELLILPGKTSTSHVRLENLPELVEMATSAEPPVSLIRLSPSSSARTFFRLGEILEADLVLRSSRESLREEDLLLHRLFSGVWNYSNFKQELKPDTVLKRALQRSTEPVPESIKHRLQQLQQQLYSSPLVRELGRVGYYFRNRDFLLRWPLPDRQGAPVTLAGTLRCQHKTGDDQWCLTEFVLSDSPEPSLIDQSAAELALGLGAWVIQQRFDVLPQLQLVSLGEAGTALPVQFTAKRQQALTDRIACALEWLKRHADLLS